MKSFLSRFLGLLLLSAAAGSSAPAGAAAPPGDNYRLAPRDLVRFSVVGEPETLVEQRLDGEGSVRLPYLGTVRLGGMTVREAEIVIEQAYRENEIFVRPQATLRVLEYIAREVSVLGQVDRPGRIEFPIESDRLDIVDVITRAGGFTRLARSSSVMVTRTVDGKEVVTTVDVERALTGRRGSAAASGGFEIFPGDTVFVPERRF